MAKILWFTGLSGSGKTTIALGIKTVLEKLGKKVDIIDGDKIRAEHHKHLGFSREDIGTNNRLIAELCKKNIKNFDFILVPIISPYEEDRKFARVLLGKDFIELFVSAPIKECIKRDVKGLYKKAISGEIKNFIGIHESNPYELPSNPDLQVDTVKMTVKESIKYVVDFLLNKS